MKRAAIPALLGGMHLMDTGEERSPPAPRQPSEKKDPSVLLLEKAFAIRLA